MKIISGQEKLGIEIKDTIKNHSPNIKTEVDLPSSDLKLQKSGSVPKIFKIDELKKEADLEATRRKPNMREMSFLER